MEKICCIVGAGPSEAYIKEDSFIIAADGGLNKLDKLNIKADLIIGDFDSTKMPYGKNVITHPIEKDDTDTLLCLKEAIKLGFKTVYISGGLGGLIDHTVANIQALIYARNKGVNAFLVGNGQCMCVINNSKNLVFSPKSNGRISLFAINGKADGVNISYLKYEAHDITLDPSFPLGVSNSFVGKEAQISVKNGDLLVIWEGTPNDLI